MTHRHRHWTVQFTLPVQVLYVRGVQARMHMHIYVIDCVILSYLLHCCTMKAGLLLHYSQHLLS